MPFRSPNTTTDSFFTEDKAREAIYQVTHDLDAANRVFAAIKSHLITKPITERKAGEITLDGRRLYAIPKGDLDFLKEFISITKLGAAGRLPEALLALLSLLMQYRKERKVVSGNQMRVAIFLTTRPSNPQEIAAFTELDPNEVHAAIKDLLDLRLVEMVDGQYHVTF